MSAYELILDRLPLARPVAHRIHRPRERVQLAFNFIPSFSGMISFCSGTGAVRRRILHSTFIAGYQGREPEAQARAQSERLSFQVLQQKPRLLAVGGRVFQFFSPLDVARMHKLSLLRERGRVERHALIVGDPKQRRAPGIGKRRRGPAVPLTPFLWFARSGWRRRVLACQRRGWFYFDGGVWSSAGAKSSQVVFFWRTRVSLGRVLSCC
mmetsp:Transcript_13293/g.32544  ORF Transcript_13293/g.32544 Transcript_13293/m.32544 type:complete len:210 (+) Transcript_13293:488-1117(+)